MRTILRLVRHEKSPVATDMVASILYVSAGSGLSGLFGFIAVSRLGGSVGVVGVLASATYVGYLWNLFLSRTTARVSLGQSIVAVCVLSGVLVLVAGFQRSVPAYTALVIGFLLLFGLFDVQYNSLIPTLYPEPERPRRLSTRYLGISVASALASAAFGRMSAGPSGHLPAFGVCGALMLFSAVIFRSLRVSAQARMEPFTVREVLDTVFGDPRFRAVAAVLTLYGWVGAGSATVLVLLYRAAGLTEWSVGILGAINLGGTVLTALLVTPGLRFRGGIANFRLCFLASSAAMLTYLLTWFTPLKTHPFWALACGNLLFGASNAVWNLAIQTTAHNLASPGKGTLAVNSLMIVIGIRGMLAPLLVAAFLGWAGIGVTLSVSLVVAIICAATATTPAPTASWK